MTARAAWTLCLIMLASAVAGAQEPAPAAPDKDGTQVHIRMHKKTAPKVVLVRGAGSQMGSGVIIQGDGVILTSPTACGKSAEEATVHMPGRKPMKAKVIGRANDLELVLLKIDAKDLPAMEFADSGKAKIGQIAYAFGDVFGSIQIDDQVSMSLGVVSGIYEVQEAQRGTIYTGPVIETSAAVNPHLDGGPLVDAQGRLLGMITLNYHPAKFTGIAIPSHVLKPEVDKMLKDFRDGVVSAGPGWLGIEVMESGELASGVVIDSVKAGSSADKVGLKKGDVILRIDADRVTSLEKFEELVKGMAQGDRLRLRILRDGKEQDVIIRAGKKPKPEPVY